MTLTTVIPAHDEEVVIGRALERLVDTDAIEVVVVANGCSDRTVERALAFGPPVEVVEVPEASKIRALNAGLEAVRTYPVAFVDADVSVSGRDLVELGRRLEADADLLVAAPTMRIAPSSSWWVRQYYRVWALTGYRSEGHVGSGVYVLSREAVERLGAFPDVIADDLYVQQSFAPDQRLVPEDLSFRVPAPETLAALLRRNTRIAAGNRQLARRFPELAPSGAASGARALLARVWRRPGLWAGFAVYAVLYLLAHRRAASLLAADEEIAWARDETTRRAG